MLVSTGHRQAADEPRPGGLHRKSQRPFGTPVTTTWVNASCSVPLAVAGWEREAGPRFGDPPGGATRGRHDSKPQRPERGRKAYRRPAPPDCPTSLFTPRPAFLPRPALPSTQSAAPQRHLTIPLTSSRLLSARRLSSPAHSFTYGAEVRFRRGGMGSGGEAEIGTAMPAGMPYGVRRPFPARFAGGAMTPAATSAWSDCHTRPGPVPRSWHSSGWVICA